MPYCPIFQCLTNKVIRGGTCGVRLGGHQSWPHGYVHLIAKMSNVVQNLGDGRRPNKSLKEGRSPSYSYRDRMPPHPHPRVDHSTRSRRREKPFEIRSSGGAAAAGNGGGLERPPLSFSATRPLHASPSSLLETAEARGGARGRIGVRPRPEWRRE